MKQTTLLLLILSISGFMQAATEPFYFCVAADSKYYNALLNLIGSLHETNFDNIGQIAVFNLGLSRNQLAQLKLIEKVQVYEVEKKNPHILKPILTHPNKYSPGSYAWKPVVIKQALDMFPYVLYIDAGTTILKPLDTLFKHIIQNDSFILDVGPWSVNCQCTRKVVKRFALEDEKNRWMLDESVHAIDAGLQGITRKYYDSYIIPLCNISNNEFDLFFDDGTAPKGFGTARHDQALFSIYVRFLGIDVLPHDTEGTGQLTPLRVDGKVVPIHITWNPVWVTHHTAIFRSRMKLARFNHYFGCIKFKKRKH